MTDMTVPLSIILKTPCTIPPWAKVEHLVPKFTWRNGHPAGYTDDLGIIADRNQWVKEQKSGWFSDIDPRDHMAIREWCEQNVTHGYWYTGDYYLVLEDEKDVAWFLLRWS